jgi:hypothetical protein
VPERRGAETSALGPIQAGFALPSSALGHQTQICPSAARNPRKEGVWCCWSALMLKPLATAPHVRDFVALVAREMSLRPEI